jgi:hypothetical protein
MPITQEEILAVMENHRDELVAHMVEETKKSITNQINWSLQTEINNIVQKFIKEEIAPEIQAQLVESKPAILKAVAVMADELSTDLAKALLETARENLNQSYKRSQILKELIS